MKKILLPLLILVVLLGATATSIYMRVGPLAQFADRMPKIPGLAFTQGPPTSAATAPPLVCPDIPVKIPPGTVNCPVEHDVASFVVPVIADGQIAREIEIDVAVVIAYDKVGDVTADMTRLQADYTGELYKIVPHLDDPASGSAKTLIHDRLLQIADADFGKGAVLDVDMKGLYQR